MPIESFLTQLIGSKYKGKVLSDPGLQQGLLYNSKQGTMIHGVASHLPAAEASTIPDSSQVVRESLENKDNNNLKKVDKTELTKLKALEGQFNKTLTEYTKQFHEYNEMLLQSGDKKATCHTLSGQNGDWGCEKNTTESNCNSMDPWKAGEERNPGFTKIGESSRCWWGVQSTENTPWSSPISGTCSDKPIQTTSATLPNCKTICENNNNCNAIAYTIGTNKCNLYSQECTNPTPQTSTSLYKYNRSSPNIDMEQKLNVTRAKLMNYADQIWKEQQKVMKTDDKVHKHVLKRQQILNKKLATLDKKEAELKKYQDILNTTVSELQNKTKDMNATYLHYLIFGAIATGLSIGAIIYLRRNS